MEFNVPEDQKNASGVYKISSSIDSRIYIGKTVNLYTRYIYHCRALERGKHTNLMLQEYTQEHSHMHMEFSVLEYCEERLLEERETYYIQKHRAAYAGYGFNVSTNKLGLSGYEGKEKLNLQLIPLIKQKLNDPDFDLYAQICPTCSVWMNAIKCQISELQGSRDYFKEKHLETASRIAQMEARMQKERIARKKTGLHNTSQLSLFK